MLFMMAPLCHSKGDDTVHFLHNRDTIPRAGNAKNLIDPANALPTGAAFPAVHSVAVYVDVDDYIRLGGSRLCPGSRLRSRRIAVAWPQSVVLRDSLTCFAVRPGALDAYWTFRARTIVLRLRCERAVFPLTPNQSQSV